MVTPSYGIFIDYDEDDSFEAGEEITDTVKAGEGVEWFRGRDAMRDIQPPRAGYGTMTARNDGGDYDIGTDIARGQRLRIQVTDPTTTTTHNAFTGIVDDLRRRPQRDKQDLEISCLGALTRLNAARRGVGSQLYEDITTGVAFGHILDAVGWPAGERDIDTGQTILEWFWLDADADPFAVARRLLDAEGPGAVFYEDGAGNFVFKDRHDRVTAANSTAIQTTFRGSGTEPVMSDLKYDSGDRDIINTATMTRTARSAKTLASVWELGETLSLAPNETKVFIVRDSSRTPFKGAEVPTDVEGDYVLTGGSLDNLTIDRDSGSSLTLTITATNLGATVTGLRVRAQTVSVDAQSDVVSSQAVTGASRPPPTSWSPWAEIGFNYAQDLVNSLIAFYGEARPTAELTVHGNRSTAALTACLEREINERVRVISTDFAIDIEGYVQQIKHRVTGGPLHTTTFGVEDAGDVGLPFIVDTDELDDPDRRVWF